MTSPDPRDHALALLLEERLGDVRPPDLTPHILSAAAHQDVPRPTSTEPFDGAPPMSSQEKPVSFEEAAEEDTGSLVHQLCGFMSENAKWWLVPFLIVFGLLGVALVLGSTGAAPFIYTMF